MNDMPDLTPPPPQEIWVVLKMAKPDIFFIRYITEAYEGLCIPTTLPGADGRVLLLTDKSMERQLKAVIDSLSSEYEIEVVQWGTGPTPRL